MWGNYPIADTNSFYQVYLQIISSAYSMFPIFQSIEDVILHSHKVENAMPTVCAYWSEYQTPGHKWNLGI